MEVRTVPATLLLFNTDDIGIGSFRQANLDANADLGPNTINFRIDSGVQTIRPISELPAIIHPTIIDGTTQPGFAGSPLIELSGARAGRFVNGLTVLGGQSELRGLVVNGFDGAGILVRNGGGNLIAGN